MDGEAVYRGDAQRNRSVRSQSYSFQVCLKDCFGDSGGDVGHGIPSAHPFLRSWHETSPSSRIIHRFRGNLDFNLNFVQPRWTEGRHSHLYYCEAQQPFFVSQTPSRVTFLQAVLILCVQVQASAGLQRNALPDEHATSLGNAGSSGRPDRQAHHEVWAAVRVEHTASVFFGTKRCKTGTTLLLPCIVACRGLYKGGQATSVCGSGYA